MWPVFVSLVTVLYEFVHACVQCSRLVEITNTDCSMKLHVNTYIRLKVVCSEKITWAYIVA